MKDFASFSAGAPQPFLEEVQKIAAEYEGKSEGELMRAVYARAVEGKRGGTLTNAEIDAFCAQISPLLDAAKRKKLQKIAEELKKL